MGVRLAIHTDYALRTLMYLASFSGRATVADVAGLFGISVHHVAKVVNQLARLGYVRSVRGIGGGIELAAAPRTIRVGDVILAFEGNLHLLECVGMDNICVIESFCKLKRVLGEAERLQKDYLDGVTLEDIVPAPRRLRQAAVNR
jgi:Rrf2 family nitric oxide-sensitive transcriptional repressor